MAAIMNDLVALLLPMLGFASIGIAYGVTCRALPEGLSQDLALGAVFGTAAVLMMQYPIELDGGIHVDMRQIAIAFAGAFGGLLSVGVAFAVGAVARLMAGGDGAIPGVIGMALAGGAGVLWARQRLARDPFSLRGLALLGAMTTVHLLAAFALPFDGAIAFLQRFGVQMAVLNVLGALVIGGAIARERFLVTTEKRLDTAANRDPLTGALNRRGFDELVRAARVRAVPGEGAMLLVIDLDRFKAVNDTHGHAMGDAVLMQTCQRLQGELRGGDVLGRFGGEEFVVFVPSVDRDQAGAVAARLQAAVGARPFEVDGTMLAVTASAGAWWFDDEEELEMVFEIADALLYQAKDGGRNRVVLGPRTSTAAQQPKDLHAAAA